MVGISPTPPPTFPTSPSLMHANTVHITPYISVVSPSPTPDFRRHTNGKVKGSLVISAYENLRESFREQLRDLR